MYFTADLDGFVNVWPRRFDPVRGAFNGPAFPMTRFEGPARGLPFSATASAMNVAVGRDLLILPVVERRSQVWLLDTPE